MTSESHSLPIAADVNLVEALRRASVENVLLPVLIQLVVILLAARLFATLAERMGQKRTDGSVFVALPLSRQDIADLVGTTIETAIRVMSRWQKEGVVETDKKGFLIRDPRALASIAPEE